MNRETNPAYYDALHDYASGLVQLLGVFGVSQADIARHCGVSRPLVTHWKDGRHLLPPAHDREMRLLLREEVANTRSALTAMDSTGLQALRDGLIAALCDLDGAALAMAREYASSVQVMNRDVMAAVEGTLQDTAHTGAVTEALHQAYDNAQQTLAALQRLWPGVKARNRALKGLVESTADENIHAHIQKLLGYVLTTYGVQEPTPVDRPGTRARRKARRSSVVAAV